MRENNKVCYRTICEMRNRQFNILEIVAIILVVCGHLGPIPGANITNQMMPIGGYHMALFIFISGYFFKDLKDIKQYPGYAWKKIKHLILPLLGWNIVYAGIASILCYTKITDYFVSRGPYFTIEKLFISPFICGDQYLLNLAGWFVVCLFFTQMIYALISLAKTKIPDWFLLIVLISLGFFGIAYFSKPYVRHFGYINLGRTLFALPFFHLGCCCKKYEDVINKIPTWLYMIVCAIGIFVFYRYGCHMNRYVCAVVYTNFNGSWWKPFVSGFLGIMVWTRIALIIANYTKHSKIEDYVAENTWCIMLHHLTVMFLISYIGVRCCSPCDSHMFRTDFWGLQPCFSYWMYAICMVTLPICFQYIFDYTKGITNRLLLRQRYSVLDREAYEKR